MTNGEICASYLRQAERILREAERHFEEEAWNLVVRRSQEAVVLALKGLLRLVGVEFPKVHDVGEILREKAERLPPSVRQEAERLAAVSERLRRSREASFYGDELGRPPETLFGRDDAASALGDARTVLALVRAAAREGGAIP